ncbi:MAG TPA: dihydroorotate dehydrogenase-like protein [Bacteroidales bacterium]|nr:dihydroorotate dehydrogenase-like protein [Bacteroidales bacterium]HRX97156.1 dihydroorotate dehydrogenase-like protein [Bacteroidales bacterium]
MADLRTNYLGLELKNPIIVGSSGLTNSVEKIKEIEQAGAGAVVLKSLFEEQILMQANKNVAQSEAQHSYPEAVDYISNYSKENDVASYLELLRGAKAAVSIPVIASINCVSSSEWLTFASKIQEAGADALELNIFVLPSNPKHAGAENEQVYFDIAMAIIKEVSIPVSIKLSYYFSGLAKTMLKLSWTGIKGIVLFNRFFSPDIDIDKFEVTATNVFSAREELATSLRWVAMLSSRIHCDIAASTGIHSGEDVVKQLLAGAKAVQIASTVYKNGTGVIGQMVEFLDQYMEKHGFKTTADFIGKMSFKETDNPAAYERVQFMKHFAGIE